MTATARDFGIICGTMPTGAKKAITDVPGVRVGHHTLRYGDINTGVTAILPHDGNLYRRKVLAACDIINGFGNVRRRGTQPASGYREGDLHRIHRGRQGNPA